MIHLPGRNSPVSAPWGRSGRGSGQSADTAAAGAQSGGTRAGQGARRYHHGRLKEALIEAARSLIERHGPQGFTLSEAAKLAGVTPAAPYRHFSDRDALMGEVACRGFEHFGARLASAWDDGRPDAMAALQRMGQAYLSFASEEPGFYFTMFGHSQRLSVEGRAAADKAFDVLVKAAAAVLRQRNAKDSGARALANEIWASSHGVATLSLGRFLETGRADCDPGQILENSVAAMIERAVWLGQ